MKRSTFAWTSLALVLVALLATACDRPAQPVPQATAQPTTSMAFPTDYAPGTSVVMPTPPTGGGKATQPPVGPTVAAPTTQAPIANPTTPPVAPTSQPANTPLPPPSPTAPVPTATTPPPAAPAGEVLYTVKAGDTLFRIALAYNMDWQTVAAYNGITNPNSLVVGQVIKIPAAGTSATPVPPTSKTYVVKVGDNLFRIALAYNLSYLTLAQYNGISWPYWVYPGQVIRIP